MSNVIHAPKGSKLTCKNWQIEAPYRMIQNNLDPAVAANPDELVVYGGKGKAARNWECFDDCPRRNQASTDRLPSCR